MPDSLPPIVKSTNGRVFASIASARQTAEVNERMLHTLLLDCTIFTTPEIEAIYSCPVHGTHTQGWHEPESWHAPTLAQLSLFTNPN